MATASGGTAKSDHARVRRRGLWRSGAAWMSGSGCNVGGRRGEKIENQGRPAEKGEGSEKILETLWAKGEKVVQIMVDKYKDAQKDSGEFF